MGVFGIEWIAYTLWGTRERVFIAEPVMRLEGLSFDQVRY